MLNKKDEIEFECYMLVSDEILSNEEMEETAHPISKCLCRHSFLTLRKDVPYIGGKDFYKVKVNIEVVENR